MCIQLADGEIKKSFCLKAQTLADFRYTPWSQVSSQTNQVKKLHITIKHVHKSLASINKKTFF